MKPIRLISLSLGLLVTLTLGLQNCKKTEPDPVKPGPTTPGSSTTATTPGSSTTAVVSKPPTMTAIPTATNISSTSALVSAVIIDNGGSSILEHGFMYYYGLNQDFKEIKLGTSSGPFPLTITAKLTNLQPNTTYKVSALASNKEGSKQVNGEFTTLPAATTTTAAGTWKEFGPYSSAFYAGYDFAFGSDLYEIGFTELSTYSLTTQKQTLNAGPKFPGTGNVGLFKLVGQKAYALMNGEGSTKSNNEIWEYDLIANKWTRKTDFPGTPRVDGKAIVLTGKLYFGTGNEYTKARPGYATSLKDWWEYDPATDKWTQKADMPVTVYDLVGFNAGGKAVLGMGLSFNSSVARESWWEYNPQTNTWRTLNKITGDYVAFSGEFWEESFTGKNYALLLNKARTNYFMWIYDVVTGSWSRSAEVPLTQPLPTSPVLTTYTINGKPIITYRDKSQAFEFIP